MTQDPRRLTAALAIYQSMTTYMFGLRDQGKLAPAYYAVVSFAAKYAVEQADLLLKELAKQEGDSASDESLKGIDLPGISKALNLRPGTDIGPQILPGILQLQARLKELEGGQ